MVKKSKEDLVREWNKLEEESEKNRLEGLVKEKKEQLRKEQRPDLRKGASQIMKKSPVDQVFDKLIAREHIILEALGFVNDDVEWKSHAVHELICGHIRNAQDELKEEYPKLSKK